MPSGGTWIAQNKVRPGAYINFVSVPKAVGTLGERGTVAIGLPMTWGPRGSIIKVTGAELLTGESIPKIGCSAVDTEESLIYRVALSGAFTALLYRTDKAGTKATATIQANSADVLTINAKYDGTSGNKITVVISEDTKQEGNSIVQVLFNNLLKEEFSVGVISALADLESQYVDFDVKNPSASVPKTAGTPLAGGTNGENDASSYPDFWKLLNTENFQCLAMYDKTSSVAPLIKDMVEIWREKRGKKVQAVVYDYNTADYEGIISVHQGFKTKTETVDETMFMLWAASQTAGAEVNESLTAAEVEGAVEIINPIDEDEIADALKAGKFVLSYRQDGAVVVEKDINTLHTFTVDKGYAFSKNRVIRCLDEIANTAMLVFNRNYCGKVSNDTKGRAQYKTELIYQIDTLVGIRAIDNFDGANDITVLPGEDVDSVVVDMTIQPVDSMEKLYMTVNVNA